MAHVSTTAIATAMCGNKKSTDVIEPSSFKSRASPRSSSVGAPSSNNPISNNFSTTGSSYKGSSYSSLSSTTSLSGIKASLPENPHIYELSEIAAATGNFLRNRFSSSSTSSSWRCSLRGKEAVVIQRKFRRPIDGPELRHRLLTICRSHHSSLIKLLGSSVSGNYIYLVYDFVPGVNLADCLRNRRNPSYTILSTWLSRMQIATDLAHGLDYIHHCSGLRSNFVHNHIKSSGIVVTEESMNARICHFGTSELCGETVSDVPDPETSGEITAEKSDGDGGGGGSKKTLKRSKSRSLKVEGTRGYMAPEFQFTGIPTQKCDIYAFGVVILELLSGEEPLKYRLEEGTDGGYRRVGVIETARAAVEGGDLRLWIDRRLRDSYPVDVAENMVRVGLECVEEDPKKRPDMGRVAVLVSKMYLESKNWADRIGLPADISVSLAPR